MKVINVLALGEIMASFVCDLSGGWPERATRYRRHRTDNIVCDHVTPGFPNIFIQGFMEIISLMMRTV